MEFWKVISPSVVVGLAVVMAAPPAFAQAVSGAGATLPQKGYLRWSEAYAAQGGGTIHYEGIGSGGGISAVRDKRVDFGASDVPMTRDELETLGFRQFPTLLSAVVPVVNLPGIFANQLRLDGAALAGLMSGKIAKWNDPALASLDPDLKLPALPVSVFYRGERSGTTAVFSAFLSQVSPAWKAAIGEGQQVIWPGGTAVEKTSGMAEAVRKTPGAIGYLDFADAVQNNLALVQLRNPFNAFVKPDMDSIRAATKFAEWRRNQFDEDPTFDTSLINQPGNNAWPITTATFVIVPVKSRDQNKTRETLKFFRWALDSGDNIIVQSGYVPLSDSVKTMVKGSWKKNFFDASGKPLM